jgi:hypothetical protein
VPDLDDIDLDLDDHDLSLRRIVLGFFRALWWLVWDFGCEWIAWSIGWPACRLLSAGRLPSVGFAEVEEAAWWEELLVILVGFAVIAALVWRVSRMLAA